MSFANTATQPTFFEPIEATIESTHQALFTGRTSCRHIVSAFLSRIEALNKHTNAIIALDPNVLTVADEQDARLANSKKSLGKLFGIPILLKDNFDTASMPTTGGCLALADCYPDKDAASVTALKSAGAIILGKANLHELALDGLTVSSLGGQTINPYDSTRTPGGSSGGSAAVVASSFCVLATGTDAVNSLRSPASACSLFSIHPTRGLISRAGIMPNTNTQDAIGPMARCVEDVAVALTVMASVGYDAEDEATALIPDTVKNVDYTDGLDSMSLRGLRFGVVEGFFDRSTSSETTPVNAAMDDMMDKLRSAGATLVPITDPAYDSPAILKACDTQRYEYRDLMNTYLSNPDLKGDRPRSLKEIFDSGKFIVIPSQTDYIKTAMTLSTKDEAFCDVQIGIAKLTQHLEKSFMKNGLDALIYPQQKNLVVPLGSPTQHGRNGMLAAVTGSPVVTVPVGFSPPTDTAPEGVPVGMEILGLPWTEWKLLGIARAIERCGKMRKTPRWAGQTVDMKVYEGVPRVVPERGNLPRDYAVGVL